MHSNTVWQPPFAQNFGYPSKKPTFNTIIQTPVSGKSEVRASLQPYPLWDIEYSLEWARGNEQLQNSVYQYLVGFFIQMGGQFSDFLYLDPNDNTVENVFLGIGDGDTTMYQLTRPIGVGTDIVQNPMIDATDPYLPLTIYISGNPTTAYTLADTGIIVFDSAPANGSVITWSGSYWYRVRFDDDGMNMSQFMDQIWSNNSIKLRSVIL